MSGEFKVAIGLKQGGVLSPAFFSVYVNNVLNKLDKHGCFIKGTCYGSFMYADDLVLLAPTLTELQFMVNVCCQEVSKVGLQLNASKSFILRFGKGWAKCSMDIKAENNVVIPRVMSGTYLGVDIVSGNKLTVNFYRPKCKFYASFNSLYSRLGHFNSEMVSLHLTNSIALPRLLYCLEAVEVNKTCKNELEVPWTRAFMKIFKTFNKNIITECQTVCGYYTVGQMIDTRRGNFLLKILKSGNILLKNLL